MTMKISFRMTIELQLFLYCFKDFLNKERLSLNLVALLILVLRHHTTEVVHKLTGVELTYKNLIEF